MRIINNHHLAFLSVFVALLLTSCIENNEHGQVKNDGNDYIGMYLIFDKDARPSDEEKVAIEKAITSEFNVNVDVETDSNNTDSSSIFSLGQIYTVQKKRLPAAPGDASEPQFSETLISKKVKTMQGVVGWVGKDRFKKKLHTSESIDIGQELLPKKLKNKASVYYVSRSDVDAVSRALVAEGYEVAVKPLKPKNIPAGANAEAFAGYQVLTVKAKKLAPHQQPFSAVLKRTE